MTARFHLQPLLDLAQTRTDDAARRLGELVAAERDVEQKLPPENFFRSSKAYLVNLEHVDGIQDEDAIVNGERVQISRAKRKAFLAALNHYMGETI